jgi:hypothetical protein
LYKSFDFRFPISRNSSAWIEEPVFFSRVLLDDRSREEETMGRGILLWLLGVPIPVIILLWLFFGH